MVNVMDHWNLFLPSCVGFKLLLILRLICSAKVSFLIYSPLLINSS